MTDFSGPCTDAMKHLWGFLDGELDAATAALIDQHMAVCPECIECLEAEKKVRATLRDCCAEHAPGELRARITVMRIRRER